MAFASALFGFRYYKRVFLVNSIYGLWRHMSVNPFKMYDPFQCLDLLLTGEPTCGFCYHCGVDSRNDLRGVYEKNVIYLSCFLCSLDVSISRNYEFCKEVL